MAYATLTTPASPYGSLRRPAAPSTSPGGATSSIGVIPVATFLSDVAAVERAYAGDSPQEILSRIRSQWYSGLYFDFLLPDTTTSDLVAGSVTGPMGDVGGVVSVPRDTKLAASVADLRLHWHAYENASPSDKVGDNPSPYLLLTSGERIDIGHVFLVMDALLHPRTDIPYLTFRVPNVDPAGWVGDVGIASVWLTEAEEGEPDTRAPRNPTPPSIDDYWQMSCPDEDLLGDVDGRVLGDLWVASPGLTLSHLLRTYYLGPDSARTSRFRDFCSANGFSYRAAGSSVTWVETWRAPWIARIDRFNNLYAAGIAGSLRAQFFGPNVRVWPRTPEMLARFLAWLKAKLEAELAGG
ncbi:MAG: hypothetical protein QOG44_1665 [Acidimicrobiaceae bacterium]|nr:hypothetical protein [Acidimicrobiaceae bacterium]